MNDMLLTFEVINNEYIGIGLKVRKNFANNWGISAIMNKYSYGGTLLLWEVAVLDNNTISYSSPLTQDVMGYLTIAQVHEIARTVSSWEYKE